ncbi:hypothetical protein FPE01S_03_05990 [Flavihumibacter petaseus NBRC 106054]|uniref:Outer membrane protein beta-barrel domain-containing protein n=2 Tax=Flavihumibacter TaxID=1004301 RepID=A0A0E9N4G8_9BACT|nr:hypothetical protein FPE01S_03_05990 [Flavihumibacter petaseus NBRC 106054]
MVAARAQDSEYKSAIGGRLSTGYYELLSASYKTFITEKGAIELDLGFRPRTYNYPGDKINWVTLAFSAAYQHHFPIQPVPGLQWYIGGGLTAYNSFSDDDHYTGFGLGIFPTGGIDYKFGNIPLNLSADFRPTFSLVDPYDSDDPYHYNGYNSFNGGNVGVSVRYTFR